MRTPWPGTSAASSGSRRNRRGGVAIEFEFGLFMLNILPLDGPDVFGLSSKMSAVGVF